MELPQLSWSTDKIVPNSPKPIEPFDISYILHTTIQTDLLTIESQSDTKSPPNIEEYTDLSYQDDDDEILPSTNLISSSTPGSNLGYRHPTKSTVDMDIIRKLNHKQEIAFYGFLRFHQILSIADYDDEGLLFVPVDVINLCLSFYQVDIRKICDNLHKERTVIFSNCGDNNNDDNIAIDLNRIDEDDLYELAMILRTQRDCFLAYEIMDGLIQHNPDLSEFHNAMGLILKKWNCLDLAAKYYKKAIECESTENIFRWNLGLVYQEQEKYELALEQFLIAEKNGDDINEKRGDYIFEAAYCYQRIGDINNATIYYLRAIELNKDKAIYWIYYAEYLCEELNDFTGSIKAYLRAISINPNDVNSYYRFARYLRDYHKDYNLSKEYYQKCMFMMEESNDLNECEKVKGINGSYGYLLYLMGEYEECNKWLSLSLITDPLNAWSYYYLSMLNLKYFKNTEYAFSLRNKSLNCCNTLNLSINDVKDHLNRLKQVDLCNLEFHNEFLRLFNDKCSI